MANPRELRPYQREDVDFLKTMNVAGIFNEQRTGKTPTALTLARECGCKKILIVCPGSAAYMWAEQCRKWTGEIAVVADGPLQVRTKIIQTWERGALIVSYDLLKPTSNRVGLIDLILAAKPDIVIADEAHRWRNRQTAVYKAMRRLRKIPKRFALSGTIVAKQPEEIWSVLSWLYPKYYTSYWNFIEEYFYTWQIETKTGHRFTDIRGFKPGKEEQLQQILSKISVQRKRKDVMPWLPEKEYDIIRLPPTEQQERYLQELAELWETGHVVVENELERLIRYRQICLDPGLVQLVGSSPKTDWLLQYLADYSHQSVLVFSKFTSYLKRLATAVDKRKIKFGLITGEVSKHQRFELVNQFQQEEIRVLLINIDAGKEALTLDRAECAIFTDIYPPAADIQQAEDRFIATQQNRITYGHKIVHLMMKGTYDEAIFQLVSRGAKAIDIVNNYNKYLKKKGRQHERC